MPHPNENYSGINTGEVLVAETRSQLPDVPCRRVMLTANPANVDTVWVGGEGVTEAALSTSATAGYPLRSTGGDTDWLYVSNLNQLWAIASAAGQGLIYIAQA